MSNFYQNLRKWVVTNIIKGGKDDQVHPFDIFKKYFESDGSNYSKSSFSAVCGQITKERFNIKIKKQGSKRGCFVGLKWTNKASTCLIEENRSGEMNEVSSFSSCNHQQHSVPFSTKISSSNKDAINENNNVAPLNSLINDFNVECIPSKLNDSGSSLHEQQNALHTNEDALSDNSTEDGNDSGSSLHEQQNALHTDNASSDDSTEDGESDSDPSYDETCELDNTPPKRKRKRISINYPGEKLKVRSTRKSAKKNADSAWTLPSNVTMDWFSDSAAAARNSGACGTSCDSPRVIHETEVAELEELQSETEDPELEPKAHQEALYNVLLAVKRHKSAWPFLQPVETSEVPDYYDIIKHPMDLQTMEDRLNKNCYSTKKMFEKDMMIMFNSCRLYNRPDTVYYKCADVVEKFYYGKLRELYGGSNNTYNRPDIVVECEISIDQLISLRN